MQLSHPLRPTGVEAFIFPSGIRVEVARATPQFSVWTGVPPASTYGRKSVVDHDGRPAFAELSILWHLQAEGWGGAWVTHGGNRLIFRVGLMDVPPTEAVPAPLRRLLADIQAERGTTAGVWDVCCWRDGVFRFAEAKRGGRDRIRADQVLWLEAALRRGVPLDAFTVVEWTLDGSAPETPKARNVEPHLVPRPATIPTDVPAALRVSAHESVQAVYQPASDADYYEWIGRHPEGLVLSVRGRQLVLHRTSCSHINRNNNSITKAPKLCSTSRAALKRWAKEQGGLRDGIHLKACGTCKVEPE